jgi:hypothetical protein
VIFFSQCKEGLFDEGKLGFFFDFADLRRITHMVIGEISNFGFSISNLLIEKPANYQRNQKNHQKNLGQESVVKIVPLGFYLKRDALEFAGDGNSDR